MRALPRTEALPHARGRPWTLSRESVHTLGLVGAGLVVGALVFLYLWQGSAVSLLRAQRAELILRLEELNREKELLQVRVLEAFSPQAIQQRVEVLDLPLEPFPPERVGYLILEDDQAAGP